MIDILVAVYNGEKYLKEQLNSLINQTYKDINIIIRDDGSTDNSLDIIKEFKFEHPEKTTLIKGNPTKSAKNNFFELLNHAKSDYIMFCDHDDIWLENKVELTLAKMQETEETYGNSIPVLCHTDLKVVDKNLNELHKSFFKMQKFDITKTSLNRALVQNIVTGCTMMINKPLIDLAKNTNSENVIMHDWWLFLIASAFGRVEVVNSPTILYRQHESNQLGAGDLNKFTYYSKKFKTGNRLQLTYNQADAFLNTFNDLLDESHKSIIKEYINLQNYSKLKKILSIAKNDFWKHSAIKKAGQIMLV